MRPPGCCVEQKRWEGPSSAPAVNSGDRVGSGDGAESTGDGGGGRSPGSQGTGRPRRRSSALLKQWPYLFLKFISFCFSCFRQGREKKWMKNTISVYQTPLTSFFQNLTRGFSFILKSEWQLWKIRCASTTSLKAPLQKGRQWLCPCPGCAYGKLPIILTLQNKSWRTVSIEGQPRSKYRRRSLIVSNWVEEVHADQLSSMKAATGNP